MNDTVILGIGTNWSSYKIDETSDQPSIVAKPAGDWLALAGTSEVAGGGGGAS